MASSGNTEAKPDHVIIWCDKNMAVEENYKASKAVLDEKADLTSPPLRESYSEMDYFICNMNPDLNAKRLRRLIRSPLRMFTNENECIKCIYDSLEAGKQPFLITSGQKGALVLPQLLDPSTGRILTKLSRCTYIFCGQIVIQQSWTKPFEKDIEIYDDERGVFGKVLLDIGIYYLKKGQNATAHPAAATQYFRWAQRLVISATKVDGINRDDYLTIIQDELSDLNAPAGDDSDGKGTEAAD